MTAPETPTWTQRPVAARLLEAGDVIVDRRERLHAVERVAKESGLVEVVVRRAGRESRQLFAPDKPVAALLTTDDRRALDLLADELGAQIVERVVA